jgi:hypothetical protein
VNTVERLEVEGLRTDLLAMHREVSRYRAQNAALVSANRDLIAQLVEATQNGGRHLRTLVAFHQLLDGSDVAAGLRNVSEILVNIIGTENFAIVTIDGRAAPRVVAGHGDALDRARHADATLDALAAEAMRVVPLRLGSRTVGVIVIDALLPHRDGLGPADEDVLEVLGRHAATAIIASAERSEWNHDLLPELA